MGWLEDLNKERVFVYQNQDDHEDKILGNTEFLQELSCIHGFDPNPGTFFVLDRKTYQAENDFLRKVFSALATLRSKLFKWLKRSEEKYLLTFVYAGMESAELGIMTKIPFEKNGRKGIRTKFGDGKQMVRSATKEAYYKGKGTESVLTKGCREASDKVKENMIHQRAVGMKRELEAHAHNIKQRGKK